MIHLIKNIWAVEIDSDVLGKGWIEGDSLEYGVSRESCDFESRRLPSGKWRIIKMIKGYCIIEKL